MFVTISVAISLPLWLYGMVYHKIHLNGSIKAKLPAMWFLDVPHRTVNWVSTVLCKLVGTSPRYGAYFLYSYLKLDLKGFAATYTYIHT